MARILAIDFGSTKSGLAISDENKIFASKLGIIKSRDVNDFLDSIKKIVNASNIKKIIIGLPDEKDFFGNISSIYGKIVSASKIIQEKLQLEVEFWNESMTTILAKQNSKKELVDDEAARIILQEYLDFINKT